MVLWRRGFLAAGACALPLVPRQRPSWCVETPKHFGSAQPVAAVSRVPLLAFPAAATPGVLAPALSRLVASSLNVPPVQLASNGGSALLAGSTQVATPRVQAPLGGGAEQPKHDEGDALIAAVKAGTVGNVQGADRLDKFFVERGWA